MHTTRRLPADALEDDQPNVALPPSKSLKRVIIDDILTAASPPPRHVIYPYVPRGQVTLLGAHGGAGKSNLALIWAACVASGRDWGGHGIEGGQVVYLTLEDPGDVVRFRLKHVAETYRLNEKLVAERLKLLDGTASDGTLVTETAAGGGRAIRATPLFEEFAAAARGADLVIIDNASDAFAGDENSRRQVRGFVRLLVRRIAAQGAGVLLIAHIDKSAARYGSAGNSYSGSTAWHNSVRSRLAIINDDGLKLVHEKHNLSRQAAIVDLIWTESGVLVPSNADAKASEQALRADSDAGVILEVIRIAIENGDTVKAALSGPSTACHVLERYPEFQPFRGKDGRKRANAAITALLKCRRLVRCTYQDTYRKTRERLELPPSASVDAIVNNAELTRSASADLLNTALHISPIPPVRTDARTERRASRASGSCCPTDA